MFCSTQTKPALVFFLALWASRVAAVSVPIINPGGELPDCDVIVCEQAAGRRQRFAPDVLTEGWTLLSGGDSDIGGVWEPGRFPGIAGTFVNTLPEGDQALYLLDVNDRLRQTLATTVEPNTRYSLRTWIGARPDVAFVDVVITMNTLTTSPGTLLGQIGPTSGAGLSPSPDSWAEVVLESAIFPAGHPAIGEPITITLINAGINQVSFDNITLEATTVIPVPTAVVLLASALLGLGAVQVRYPGNRGGKFRHARKRRQT